MALDSQQQFLAVHALAVVSYDNKIFATLLKSNLNMGTSGIKCIWRHRMHLRCIRKLRTRSTHCSVDAMICSKVTGWMMRKMCL